MGSVDEMCQTRQRGSCVLRSLLVSHRGLLHRNYARGRKSFGQRLCFGHEAEAWGDGLCCISLLSELLCFRKSTIKPQSKQHVLFHLGKPWKCCTSYHLLIHSLKWPLSPLCRNLCSELLVSLILKLSRHDSVPGMWSVLMAFPSIASFLLAF